MIFSFLFLFL